MKLALVTGGGYRLGAAISIELARRGYALAIHSHRDGEPDPALLAICADHATRWASFKADFRDTAQTDRLIGDVADHFGGSPTCLVNNAAVFGGADWRHVEVDDMVDFYRINAATPARLIRAMAELEAGDGPRAVVNILDQAVRNPTTDHAGYTASKLALSEMTRVMARAHAPHLRVNAVAPGLTLPTADYAELQLTTLAQMMPLGRLPVPRDIGEAVAFLADAPSITGQTLFVDCGANMLSFDRDFFRLGTVDS